MRAYLALAEAVSACGASSEPQIATHQVTVPVVVASPVMLTATDGVRINSNYRRATAPKALILLFNQAGSGRSEYATIALGLAAASYS